jgi:putative sterol carrier protein
VVLALDKGAGEAVAPVVEHLLLPPSERRRGAPEYCQVNTVSVNYCDGASNTVTHKKGVLLMTWRIEGNQPIDVALRDAILDKIEEGSFGMEDLKDYFTVFTQISNNTEDIQDEVEGFDRTFLYKISGRPVAWLSIKDGKFEMGLDGIEGPDITLDMSEEVAIGMFSGQVDPTAAYMSGDLRVDGVINDAIVLRNILNLVYEEME